MSCTSASIRAEPLSPSTAIGSAGRSRSLSSPARTASSMSWLMYATRSITRTIRPSSVLGSRRAAGVPRDPVAHLLGQVQPDAVALEVLHDPQRVLVVAEVPAEALFQAAVQHLLADVPERRVPEVVAQADRLDQVLVQAQRPRHRARDRSSPRACASAACGSDPPRAPRTPASCASAGGTPCCGRSCRGRAGTACAARSPPPRAPAAPDRSGPPAARAAAPPARAALREAGRDRLLWAGDAHRLDCAQRGGGPAAASSSARFQSLRPVSDVHPVAPALLVRRVLVVAPAPPPGCRQAVRGRRVDAQIHPVFVDRRHRRPPPRSAGPPAWRSAARGRCPSRAPPARAAPCPPARRRDATPARPSSSTG